MRALLVVATLSLTTARGEACPIYDFTFVRGSYVEPRPQFEPAKHGPVPPNPRIFIHLGSDSEPGLPEFLRIDGTRIPYKLSLADKSPTLLQADLEIESGRIFVRHADDPDATEEFVIEPSFAPSTRAVRVGESGEIGETYLDIDSDAVMFRVEANGQREMWFNYGDLSFDPTRSLRVTALYGDHREEVIFDYRPARRDSRSSWPALFLILATLVAARCSVKASEGTAA